MKHATAPSLASFIDWMVSELDKGNFLVTEEEDEEHGMRSNFAIRHPANSHFLDAMQVMANPNHFGPREV